jgi:hypothetical protein
VLVLKQAFAKEYFDELTNTFEKREGRRLEFEHSLFALSKWESFFEKPFLNNEDRTTDEKLWYFHAMLLTPDVSLDEMNYLNKDDIEALDNHINAKMTATWFSDRVNQSAPSDVITNELIYFWMTQFKIPFECQHWHLNRLLTLIRVCSTKNEKPKKMNREEWIARQRSLNEQRRSQSGSAG